MSRVLLRSVFGKTFYDLGAGVLGWGLGLLVLLAVGIGSYGPILGKNAPDRAAQAAQFMRLMSQFSGLIGEMVPIDNIGGFLTLRLLVFLPVVVGVWAVIVGAGLVRGEEEAGILDLHQAAPHARLAVIGQKFAGFTLACALITAIGAVGLVGIAAVFDESVALEAAGLGILNAVTLSWFWGAAALLLGQLVIARRTAAGIAGGLMVAAYLLDANLTNLASYKWLAGLLPHHYFTVNKPLVPGRVFAWDAYLVLVVGGLLLAGLAALLYRQRDLGDTFRLGAMGQARVRSGGWTGLLGSVFSRALRDLLGPTLAWGLGMVLYSVLIIASTNELLEPMRNLMKGPLGLLLGPMNTTMGLLQATVLTFTTFLLAGFGLTQVASWADDEESGRLETVLGTPHARSAVVLARFAALLIALLGMVLALGAALWASGQVFKVDIDAGKLWAGMMWDPLESTCRHASLSIL